MQLHEATKNKLSQCDRIVYLHVDHFEPSSTSNFEKVDLILKRMISDIKMGFFRPSLFFKITAGMKWKDNAPLFSPTSQHNMVMSHVKTLAHLGYDIHLHIHHERWTRSELTNHDWKETFKKESITDSELFELFVKGSMEEFRKYGLPIRDWGFVHGRWALNASDPLSCNITDEIEILRRNGCVADFTMPAGRSQCTPSMKGIFVIKPQDKPKCYNTGGMIDRGTHLLDDPNAFIICYPSSNYMYVSLDNLILRVGTRSDTLFRSLIAKDNSWAPEDPKVIIQEWILCSHILDRTLVIKTHSHNMRLSFWDDKTTGSLINNSPIFSSRQKERMYLLQEICKDNNLEDLKQVTARELIKFVRWVDGGKESRNYAW